MSFGPVLSNLHLHSFSEFILPRCDIGMGPPGWRSCFFVHSIFWILFYSDSGVVERGLGSYTHAGPVTLLILLLVLIRRPLIPARRPVWEIVMQKMAQQRHLCCIDWTVAILATVQLFVTLHHGVPAKRSSSGCYTSKCLEFSKLLYWHAPRWLFLRYVFLKTFGSPSHFGQ
jgi:hypothetical protein